MEGPNGGRRYYTRTTHSIDDARRRGGGRWGWDLRPIQGVFDALALNEVIRAIRRKGRKAWKQTSHYHRRSLTEMQIYRYT